MNLTIENIGLIKNANINFNGLTLIAGENDAGKSTIGRIIFAIVKAVNESLSDIENQAYIDQELTDKTHKRVLSQAFNLEFYSEFSPKYDSSLTSIINFFENNEKIIDIEMKDNQINKGEILKKIFFDDVTLIESPIILQMWDVIELIKPSLTSYEKNYKISLHLEDLILKLLEAQAFAENPFSIGPLSFQVLQNTSNLLKGGFRLEKSGAKADFIFSRNVGRKKVLQIKAVNVASGIKSFGMIQLLLQAGILDERGLLIIDEPETHLHPKWQIEYAKMVIELVENNIFVLLTSHSPEMIQALRRFSEERKLEDRVSYYLAEKATQDNFSIITDVTEDLNRIFKKLSEPLHQLVWN